MNLPKVTSRVAFVLVMLAGLTAGLVYLYVNSRAVKADDQNDALNLLKDIKQMDSDWSANVLRSHTDINLNYDPLTEPLRPFADAIVALQAKVAVLNDADIDRGIKDIRETIAGKTVLIDAFKAQNSLYKNSLRYVPTAHRDIQIRVRSERDAGLSSEAFTRRETTRAFAELEESVAAAGKSEVEADAQRRIEQALARMRSKVKSASPTDIATRASVSAMDLEGGVSALVDETLRYSAAPDRETAEAVRGGIDRMRTGAPGYPASVREPVANLLSHLDTLLRLRFKQTELLRQIAQIPVASRVDAVSALLTQRFSAELTTQFKFQRYLLAYSALVLLMVAGSIAFILYRNGTERRRLTTLVDQQTAALKESEVQLIHTQKMSAIGEMVAGVAHEVNTPLAAVKSGLQSMRELIADIDNYFDASGKFLELCVLPKLADETARNHRTSEIANQYKALRRLGEEIKSFETLAVMAQLMDDGIDSVEHIYSVVVNMLNFCRLDSTKIISCNVETGIDSTLIIANHLLRSIKLSKLYGDTQLIHCDIAQINQVVLNLVKNAVQALPEFGGAIDIRTFMYKPEEVQIDITDNGTGIAPDVLPKIWDPFFTTKGEGVGTGLGLSTCRKIIAAHGGRMNVESTVGRGTTFSVILPVVPPASLFERHGQRIGSQLVTA